MPSKPNVLIVGPSGSGKSSSFEHLPKVETALIDCECKGFPFLGAESFAQLSEATSVIEVNEAIAQACANPAIKIIVLDSLFKYSELADFHAREVIKKSGWDIQNWHNAQIGKLFDLLKASKKVFILTDLDEIVYIETPEGTRVSRQRAAIKNKQWEGKIEKEFLITLTTEVRLVSGKPNHFFRYRADGIGPSKCPPFIKLPDPCPNNLSLVIDQLKSCNLL